MINFEDKLTILIKVEPYWNVNLLHSEFHFQKDIKVEPYWNVNFL